MTAFLLAAGLGTRLRPVTNTLPKCLVPIAGRPLLGWWLDLLAQHGVKKVLVNLHHLPVQVLEFVRGYRGPVSITTVLEPALLGSAGTLWANRAFVRDAEQFLILYADNLTSLDITALVRFNSERPAPLTVGLFQSANPSACGIATLDDRGIITAFVEKPEHPQGDLASAGVFVARQELFDSFEPEHPGPYDFGGDVMPRLIGRMNGVRIEGYLRDVGTLDSLALAEKEWQSAQR